MYTAKELQNLKDAYMRGLSYNQMELLFKSRTRHALESKLSELGVATRRNYMLKRETGIEATVREWLQAWGLDFATQVPISNMVVDFCKDFLVIEVLGSYWHSDKRLYPKGPKYAHQKLAVRRDAKRRRYLLQHGYSILYIWEYDLEHNLQETKKALQVVLNSDVWNNNRPISVELLRDNTEITKSITKGDLAS